MKKLIISLVIILLPLYSFGQSIKDSIEGIGNYIIGDFTIKDLNQLDELKVLSFESDTNSKIDHVEIVDTSIFELESDAINLKDAHTIQLFFYHDTLFSIKTYSTPEFKDAFFKKYGKAKLRESHSYTICKPCLYCKPNQKMKNFDSTYSWYYGNITTKFSKNVHRSRLDNGDCYGDEEAEIFSITDIFILQKAKSDGDKKIKKDGKEKYDNQVNKIYKKI